MKTSAASPATSKTMIMGNKAGYRGDMNFKPIFEVKSRRYFIYTLVHIHVIDIAKNSPDIAIQACEFRIRRKGFRKKNNTVHCIGESLNVAKFTSTNMG